MVLIDTRLTDMFLAQLESEGPRTRRALECVPDGHDDWQPHPKSMPLARLAMLVAGIPSWLAMIVEQDSLDLNPPGGPKFNPPPMHTRKERLQAVEDALSQARKAIENTNDEHLRQPWRLLEGGRIVSEDARHIVLRDTFMHLAHHRGQLTVYLRLLGAKVPAIYGPSADEHRFD